MPEFSYNRGKKYLEEQKAINLLMKANHNLDNSFVLMYERKKDARDLRSLVYTGKFVFPSTAMDQRKLLFWKADLVQQGRTNEVQQVDGRLLKEVEDLSATALPSSSDSKESHVHGGAKHVQIGVEAATALISGMMQGPVFTDTRAVLMFDLFVRVGDFMQAYCKIRNTFGASMYFFGLCENQTEHSWILSDLEDQLSAGFLEEGKLPSGEVLEESMPNDLLEALPPPPKLNHLIITGEELDKQLYLPAHIVKQWSLHQAHGKEFTKWLDEFLETYKIMDGHDADSKKGDDKKRGKGLGNDDGSPCKKKPKCLGDASLIVETSKNSAVMLAEHPVTGVKDCKLQIRAQGLICILNKGVSEVTFPEHHYLTSWGKGSFKLAKATEEAGEKAIELDWSKEGSDHMVCFNGGITTLGQVVHNQRATKPGAGINYHEMTLNQDRGVKHIALLFPPRLRPTSA